MLESNYYYSGKQYEIREKFEKLITILNENNYKCIENIDFLVGNYFTIMINDKLAINGYIEGEKIEIMYEKFNNEINQWELIKKSYHKEVKSAYDKIVEIINK